jgi:hypothetical protein
MTLRTMSLAEFGRSAQAEGQKVICDGGVWWREVRPFFARPLLPYRPAVPTTDLPWRYRLGGLQYAARPGETANSHIELIMFPAAGYNLAALPHKRRWEVRAAERHFSLRMYESASGFAEQAHPVYVDFFRRTRYGYRSDRLDRVGFDRWTDVLFGPGKANVLGAFAGGQLEAVGVLRAVEGTLHYSSFFARGSALRHHVASLMLHRAREMAAAAGDIVEVFAGVRKTGADRTVDDFYLHRGAEIRRIPACLRLNPLAKFLLRGLAPERFRRLTGAEERGA